MFKNNKENIVEKISLYAIFKSLANAMDLISDTVVGHHKKVAYISLHLGEELNLSEEEKQKLVLAALIHDLGVFYLGQKFSDLSFDKKSNEHAFVGYKLAEGLLPVQEIPEIIRYHHSEWQDYKNKNMPDSICSFILFLADRIAVLIEENIEILSQVDKIKKVIKNNSYRFWPEAIEKFIKLTKKEAFWLDLISNTRIEKNIDIFFQQSNKTINLDELLDISNLISHIIDFKSPFTATHSDGIATISEKLARKFNFDKKACKTMEIAGYLHDIGKLAVPTEILNKPGKLNNTEWNIMKTHTYFTYNSLATTEQLNIIKEWGSYHHEKLDGTGYPFHLKGNELSQGARIMAVADVFTAITESRPYRDDIPSEKVKEILHDMVCENALDGEVVSVIIDNFDEFNSARKSSQKKAKNYYRQFQQDIDEKIS